MAHLEVRNITRSFGTHNVLKGVSFEVEKGGVLALLGPSGCGKTTALRIIMGLDTATSGEVKVAGRTVSGCGFDRGMVFQHAELLPWRSTLSNIGYGLEAKGMKQPELARAATHYLDLVGLSHAKDKRPHQLSGGMKQRVGIARALAIDPEVLLMDEPFGALDSQTREGLHSELLAIHAKTEKTIIFVTHDLDEAVLLSDRVAVMQAGKIAEMIPIDLGRPRHDMRAIRTSAEYSKKRTLIWEALHDAGASAAA
jgi:NitT/TauT family transport system ATP-binding protein